MISGKIYVIGTTWLAPVKIGVAQDVRRRLSVLQAGNPEELIVFWESDICSDAYAVEAYLHQLFSQNHVRGEWFRVSSQEEIETAFSSFGGRERRTKKARTSEAVACCKAVASLIARVAQRERCTVERAISVVGDQTGVGRRGIWRLKYRLPVDVAVGDYERVAKAIWAESGRDFGLRTFLPGAEEMLEVIDVLDIRSIYEPSVSPSQDHRENSRDHMARFERMAELERLLVESRNETEPNRKERDE